MKFWLVGGTGTSSSSWSGLGTDPFPMVRAGWAYLQIKLFGAQVPLLNRDYGVPILNRSLQKVAESCAATFFHGRGGWHAGLTLRGGTERCPHKTPQLPLSFFLFPPFLFFVWFAAERLWTGPDLGAKISRYETGHLLFSFLGRGGWHAGLPFGAGQGAARSRPRICPCPSSLFLPFCFMICSRWAFT